MNKIIECPNLPSSNVTVCAVGQGNNETSTELEHLGVSVLTPVPCAVLEFPENTHADMLMLHLGGEIVLSADQPALSKQLIEFKFSVLSLNVPLKAIYPDNILLNAAVVGNRFFAHPLSIKQFEDMPFSFFPVRQGYAKCSACIVGENAVITEDENLYSVMTAAGLDVLKIGKGGVALNGMPYGFFGGATGKLSQDTLAINGELRYNTDSDSILSFLRNYRIDVISLKKGNPEDIGGILPLMETRGKI